MNKYTLTFRCENLEQKYQDFRYLYTLPICKCLNAICFLLLLFQSVTFIIQNQMVEFFIYLFLLIVVISAQFFIFNNKRKWVDYYLLLLNHFLMLQQQFVEDEFEKQEAFVFGQNQMLLNIMIILVSEFKFGSIQIFGNMTIKIVLSKYYQPSMPYVNIIYSIVVGLMFLYSSFKVHQQYRLSFLFKVKDSQQEQLIPLLTDSPFVLCTYDKDNLQFKQKFSNLQNHQEFKQFQTTHDALNFILRNYVIFGQSLEKFLLTRQKKSEDLIVNKILEVKSINHTIQEQKLCIRYSECYITELIFILIIDKKRQEIQNLNQKLVYYEQGLNKFLSHFRNFLKQQIFILDKSLNHNQNSIYQAIIKLMYIFSKFRNKTSCKITNQSFLLSFKKYAKLYSQAYDQKKIKIECCPEIKEISTIENSLDEFMIHFFTHIFKTKAEIIQIYLCKSYVQQNEFIDIIIKVDIMSELYIVLQKSTHFRKILKSISPYDYVILNDDSLIVRLYKNMNEINQLSSFLIKAEQFKKTT
ncbi:unnamed protein product (macronuclear) [Paramecium tetraurelia]|uniref:Transmembrane protein n=1 Tax=Paramecium tetraurelia TaxID=5888 RepID=A0D096_PARTE|nr:uncharacterized protein GSPATT00012015001 [Paramecium tetraurelia]CAK76463.1 unnamed protein product [Paramecium tetraurelia]|eukprot:XP_001443860.1 hypothetical protein (macronuclear) [Paramecium tetraurelia strain d4-2]